MRIPVNKYIDNIYINKYIKINNNEYILDYLFGWFIGLYLSYGDIIDNVIHITNITDIIIDNIILFVKRFNIDIIQTDNIIKIEYEPLVNLLIETCNYSEPLSKYIPNYVFTAPNDFKGGLLQSYFDCNCVYNNNNIIIYNNSIQLINDISLLLNYFGIFGYINKNENIYKLTLSEIYISLYNENIGSLVHNYEILDNNNYIDEIDKINGLNNIINYCNEILNIEKIDINNDISRSE